MRRLTFLFVLLCWSTQAMAADPCASLQGKYLSIDANGFHGTIAPDGFVLINQNNTYTFQTTVQFVNEPADQVTGQCKDRHITFTRTRAGVFVQNYDGWIYEKEPIQMAGTFTHQSPPSSRMHQTSGWCAEMNGIVK